MPRASTTYTTGIYGLKDAIEHVFSDLLRSHTDIHEFDKAANSALVSFLEDNRYEKCSIRGFFSARRGTVEITMEDEPKYYDVHGEKLLIYNGTVIPLTIMVSNTALIESARSANRALVEEPPVVEDCSFYVAPRNATLAYDLAMKGIKGR
jgi:hypothetical protein